MAIKQVYRGAPTTKHYEMSNNFSGGINNVDVDDMVYSNQFRELENVELKDYGMLQNRKGFGFSDVLNAIIEDWNEVADAYIDDDKIRFLENSKDVYSVDVLVDTTNILDTMAEYDDYAKFVTAHYNYSTALKIGILYSTEDSSTTIKINYGVLSFNGFTDGTPSVNWEPDIVNNDNLSANTRYNKPLKITDINKTKQNDSVYFNLSEVNSELQTVLEVVVTNDNSNYTITSKIINKENGHIPNPYEVSNIGFNILLTDPTQIGTTDTSIRTIRSVYLTNIGDNLTRLTYIPNNGKFRLHIIKTGEICADTLVGDNILFYVEDPTKIYPNNRLKYTRTLTTVDAGMSSGKIVYDVELDIQDPSKTVNILIEKITKYTQEVEEIDLENIVDTYSSVSTMIDDLTYDDTELFYTETADAHVSGKKRATVYRGANYGVEIYNWEEKTVDKVGDYFKVASHYYKNENTGHVSDSWLGKRRTEEYITDWAGHEWLEGSLVPAIPEGYGYHRYGLYKDPKIILGGAPLADIPMISSAGARWNNVPVHDRFDTLYKQDYINKGLKAVLVDVIEEEEVIEGVKHLDAGLFHIDGRYRPDVMSLSATEIGLPTSDIYFKTQQELLKLNKAEQSMGKYFRITNEGEVVQKYENLGAFPQLGVADVVYVAKDTNKAYKWTTEYVEMQEEDFLYYSYNGGSLGSADDFTLVKTGEKVDIEFTEFTFQTIYDIGTNVDLKPISSLDLSNFKMLEIGDRLCIYSGNTIWFSDLFTFNYFPESNYVVLPINGDSEITKIAYFRGSYIILTTDSIYRMSGTFGSDDFSVVLISDSIGCIAPDSVRGINNTLVFLSIDGLYIIKQNYYTDGLENVEKIDKQLVGLYAEKRNAESILYNEQYLLFVKNRQNEYVRTVKQYYNMSFGKNMYPYTVDTYLKNPKHLSKLGTKLYSLKDKIFYRYDHTYTDFLNEQGTVEESTYNMKIVSSNYSLGYPTHNKKFKNLFLKTKSEKIVPVKITVYVDSTEWVLPEKYVATINNRGEVVYELVNQYNLTARHARLGVNPSDEYNEIDSNISDLGEITYTSNEADGNYVGNVENFTLGVDSTGEKPYQVHKLVVAGKGKTYAIKVEQKTSEMFGLLDIGILYKLGKVKEG